MATPADEFNTVRDKATKARVILLKKYLGQAGVEVPDHIADDPQLMLRFVKSGVEVKDQKIMAKIGVLAHDLETFINPVDSAKLIPPTGGVGATLEDSYYRIGPDADDFVEKYRDLESRVIKAARDQGVDVGEFSTHLHLERLRVDLYKAFTAEFGELTGMRELLETQGSGQQRPLTINERRNVEHGYAVDPDINDLRENRRPYHTMNTRMIDPDTPMSPRAAVLNRMNLQVRSEQLDIPGATPLDAYRMSGAIPKMDTVLGDLELLESGIPTGSQAILDIETAGLSQNQGMWQLAVRYSGSEDVDTLLFPNPMMERGAVSTVDPDTGARSIKTLSNYLTADAGYSSLDDLKRVLGRMADSDVLVGHNIGQFDMPYIISDLERVAAALSPDGVVDDDILALKDRLEKKQKAGDILDTITIVKQKADDLGLGIADDLADYLQLQGGGQLPRRNTLQNILLQTNLLDQMTEKHGTEHVYELLSGMGTHNADVDTLFTAGLADPEILENLQVVSKEDFKIGNLGSVDEAFIDEVRRSIIESKPLAPSLGLEPRFIDPVIQEVMDRNGIESITPIEQNILLQRIRGQGLDDIDIPGGFDFRRTLLRGGAFDIFQAENFGEMLPDDYAPFQEQINKMHLPFRHLSFEERQISAALAGVSNVATQNAEVAAQLDGNLPNLSWYSKPDAISILGSRRVAIPKELLIEAERAGVFTHKGVQRTALESGEELFELSPFKTNYSRHKNVGISFKFSADLEVANKEIRDLFNFIAGNSEVRSRFNITDDVLEQLMPIFRDVQGTPSNLATYGIQIGTATGFDDKGLPLPHNNKVDEAYDMLVTLSGRDPSETFAPADESTMNFAVGHVGEAEEVGGVTVHRSGPVVLNTGMDAAARSEYVEHATRSASIFDQFDSNDPILKVAQIGRETGTTPTLERGLDFIDNTVIPNKRKILTGAAGIGALGAYYLYRRHENNQRYYTDTLSEMPKEEGDWYQQYQSEMSTTTTFNLSNSRGYARPLSTSAIMGELDYDKIGHNNMGPDKHAYLFGGL